MRWYKADLHIHTVLSACAELSMGPKDIVNKALNENLAMIAITDHNSAENVQAVINAAKNTQLTVIPGIEVYSREDAHFICLFETVATALEFQDIVYAHLPQGKYDQGLFGQQFVVDEHEHILYENKRFLSMPTSLKVEQLAHHVDSLGGIIYPAHIDRKSNSLLNALGFIPSDLPFNALEISLPLQDAVKIRPMLKQTTYTIIRSSDAHDVHQIGTKFTHFKLERPSFQTLKQAIQQQDGSLVDISEHGVAHA